ncbi:sigma 54-interacting transcriptional regulator [Polyangium mundeleinium]|uniref:Sigma 54-interacting transcriptional regulator n=1 Tax=Polyangium mundeleinium TaxID=2995306 RepID=A0ABT5F1G5_9BACT|nr:sigma 54-interacting transcriptional regulator [Polyangium mundeleinium]MDC0747900.1 sigma 54-interacting transcriptional regulator [Polyangium mundeleinium]
MTRKLISLGTTQDPVREQRRAQPLARPFLFVVLHCGQPALGGARYGLAELDVVDIGRGASRVASRICEGGVRRLDLRLPDATISKTQGRLVRSGDTWVFEDAGSRNGSYVNDRRVTKIALSDGDFIELGNVILRYRAGLPSSPTSAADLELDTPEARGLQTLVPPLADELDALARIARAPIPVLLLGESGTGKEVLASNIHTRSGRAGPLVAVNCGALTASLLESQLFGHVKGAFTGAIRDEPGYVRRADGGTLFLDEVGDLPLPAQAALLRVLEENEVVPVGGSNPIKVDLRVVAATHKPLDKMAIRGELRVDLLARLSGHRHTLTRLRDRIEDMGILVRDLLGRSKVPGASELGFTLQAGKWLLSQPWSLNIRELSQVLGVAAALADGPLIERAHLIERSLGTVAPPEEESVVAPEPEDERDTAPDALRGRIVALLEKHRGNVSGVARDMGKSRVQIHRWIQRFSISVDTYRG